MKFSKNYNNSIISTSPQFLFYFIIWTQAYRIKSLFLVHKLPVSLSMITHLHFCCFSNIINTCEITNLRILTVVVCWCVTSVYNFSVPLHPGKSLSRLCGHHPLSFLKNQHYEDVIYIIINLSLFNIQFGFLKMYIAV